MATTIKTATGRLKMFAGLPDLASYADSDSACRNTRQARAAHDDWYGDSYDRALELTRMGEEARAASSNALLEQYESLSFPTAKSAWRNDVCGALPNVQAFIAGHPMAMRRRVKTAMDSAPIVVFVDLFVSNGFSHEAIETRGAAILALVRILSARRSVELYVGKSTHDKADRYFSPVIRLDTAPLDLARAAYVLCSPSFNRRVLQAVCAANGVHEMIPAFNGNVKAQIAPAFAGSELILCPGMIGCSDEPSAAWNNPRAFIDNAIRTVAPELMETD